MRKAIFMSSSQFSRILLKLSGEILKGPEPFGIDYSASERVADCLYGFHQAGIELGVVIGGGNIYRGFDLSSKGIARTPADQIGMLATLMNGVALQEVLRARGIPSVLVSALECPEVAESYEWHRVIQHLQDGKIVIFVGGTGNPYFTTDTAAALRASEIEADVLMKATKVDGIYDKDPLNHSDAKKYERMTYEDVLQENLKIMDATAITLCKQNKIPIYVFNMKRFGEESVGSLLSEEGGGTWVLEKDNQGK